MANYLYKCPNEHYCEHQRSIMDEEPRLACPECGEEVKRVYTTPQFSLIGRGFYRNGG